MPLTKLIFRPGIVRDQTDYANEGGWYDCDKVRFRAGMPEKIGGWMKYSENSFDGVCRLLFNWVSLPGENLLAMGTHKRFYIEYAGAYYDVTPIVVDVTENNAITTGTAGSTIVTFSTGATPHEASVGDYVIVSGAATVDGIPAGDLNAEHVILTTPTTTTFTVEVATPCTLGGVNGGGAATQMEFLYSVGLDVNYFGAGWGAGSWGRGTWGSAASVTVGTSALRIWSADNYGEDLFFCPREGPIFFFDTSAGVSTTRGVLLSGLVGASDVPEQAFTLMVTNERHLVAFGCTDISSGDFDPLLIRWSTQEDYTDWTPSATNTAGEIRLGTGSFIVTAMKARQEMLVWTDSSVHSVQYLGPPFTFGQQTLSENTSICAPNAAVAVNNNVYWMGKDQFYVYTGRVDIIPCPIQQYIFNDVDPVQLFQTYGGTNDNFGEVTWFYCSNGSYVVDKYVTFNYVENVWYYGTMERTSWLNIWTRNSQPYATAGGYGDTEGFLYVHDVGTDDGSETPALPIEAFIESSDIDIGDGERFMFVDRVIPDFSFEGSEAIQPELEVTLSARNTPGGASLGADSRGVTRASTVPVTQYTEQLWVRLRGRQIKVRIASDTAGVKWRAGALRINARTDGKR